MTLATTWNALEQVRLDAQRVTQVRAEGGLDLVAGSRDGAEGTLKRPRPERQRDREKGLPICFLPPSPPKSLLSNPVLTVAFLLGRDLHGFY